MDPLATLVAETYGDSDHLPVWPAGDPHEATPPVVVVVPGPRPATHDARGNAA